MLTKRHKQDLSREVVNMTLKRKFREKEEIMQKAVRKGRNS